MESINIPEHPHILPKPKFVKCPRDSCGAGWYWRTWWQGKTKTACSTCKSTIIPVEIPDEEAPKKLKLIKCPGCGYLQWYVGDKEKTGCNANGCGKKNILVKEISYAELEATIRAYSSNFTLEEEEYYGARLEEYEDKRVVPEEKEEE